MQIINQPLLREIARLVKIYINNYDNPYFFRWYFSHAKRLKNFKDKHLGQDCFIIGNGPSLNDMDLRPLKNYHTFGLNKIYLLFDKVELNLSYHVSVNKLVIQQSIDIFKRLPFPTFLSYQAARNLIGPLEHVYFIYTGGPISFNKDLTKRTPEGATVTFVAIQIAFYMGFQRVFLIGVDHNFKSVGMPNEKQVLNGADLNHFDSDYFRNKEWQLPDLEASELAYHLAKFYYGRSGRQIFDATLNGKLNIFPKIPYGQAIKLCSPK